MCGLVGVAGTMQLKHEQAFKDLLVVDVIRGPDSTGIMGASGFDGVQIVKKALLPNELFTLRASEELFRSYNYILMGHNRWATQGAVNGVNAHPFQFEDLVGMHNGTLVNQTLLPDSDDFEVDSENVFHSIQTIGVKETYKLLHGAASLVWFEEDKRQLSFLRNKERPMYITYTPDRKTLFWASESWMLEGVLWKNNIDHTDIYNTLENKLYEFHIPNHTDEVPEGIEKLAFPKVKITELEAYVPPKKLQAFSQHNAGNTTSVGQTNTQNGGTNEYPYAMGDEIYFYLDQKPDDALRYMSCTDSQDFSRPIRVYCSKDSWLRRNAKAKDTDLYLGRVNGFIVNDTGFGVVVQENSVFTVEQTESEVVFDDDIPFSIEEFSLQDREHQLRVLDRCNSTCGLCSEHVAPNPHNYCLSDNDMICHACRDTEYAKELISTY